MFSLAKVKVILLPIGLTDEDFEYFSFKIKSFESISLNDIKFPDGFEFKSGQVNFEFLDCRGLINQELQELEISKMILGVIGITSGQEIASTYKEYERLIKQKYNNSVSILLAADDGLEDKKDWAQFKELKVTKRNTTGLNLILNDFTSQILFKLTILAAEIRQKSIIQGPIFMSPVFQQGKDSSTPSESKMLSALLEPDKLKKKTLMRVLKLLGDIYLLGGRLDLSMELYGQASDGARVSSDWQWLASALNGLAMTKLLIATYKSFRDKNPKLPPTAPVKLPNFKTLFKLGESDEALQSVLSELPEKYREIFTAYEKAFPVGVMGYYPLPQILVGLEIARFLAEAHVNAIQIEFLNSGGYDWFSEISKTAKAKIETSPTAITQQAINKTPKWQEENGIVKIDALTWITRILLCSYEYLSSTDQIVVFTQLADIADKMNCDRKRTFFLYKIAQLFRIITSSNPSESQVASLAMNGIKRMAFQALESKKTLVDGGKLTDDELLVEKYGLLEKNERLFKAYRKYGNTSLRVLLYKDIVAFSIKQKDYISAIFYLRDFIQKLSQNLESKDQQHYSNLLVKTVKECQNQLISNLNLRDLNFNFGLLLLKSIQVLRPEDSKFLAKNETKAKEKSIFLYSPFENKKAQDKKPCFYAKDEIFYVEATFANPFPIDIPINNIKVCGAGIKFKNLGVSTIVVKESTSHIVRLMVLPLESGTLTISGIGLEIFDGFHYETYKPLDALASKRILKSGLLKPQMEVEKFGSRKFQFVGGADETEKVPLKPLEWGLTVPVTETQPMLQLVSTSVGSHQSITLFRGERSSMSIKVKNVGKVPINRLFMTILDQMVTNDAVDDKHEVEVYQASINACYLLENDLRSIENLVNPAVGFVSLMTRVGPTEPYKLDTELQPGKELDIKLGLFGKRDCTGITIMFNYGTNSVGEDQSFYTRTMTIPFMVTIVDGLSCLQFNCLHNFSESSKRITDAASIIDFGKIDGEETPLDPRLSIAASGTDSTLDSFVFTFDMKNDWDEPFKITFDIYNDDTSESPTSTITTFVHSGVRKRIILPFSRLKLAKEDFQKPIPTAVGKQYIVPENAQSQGEARALFWFRNKLIGGLATRGRVFARWSLSDGRNGFIGLRDFKLDSKLLSIVKCEPISIKGHFSGSNVKNLRGLYSFGCKSNEVVTLNWTITNLEYKLVHLKFTLILFQETNSGEYVETEEVLVIGSKIMTLPPLNEGREYLLPIQMIFRQEGNYKISAEIEKIAPKPTVEPKKSKGAPIDLEDIERRQIFQPGIKVLVGE